MVAVVVSEQFFAFFVERSTVQAASFATQVQTCERSESVGRGKAHETLEHTHDCNLLMTHIPKTTYKHVIFTQTSICIYTTCTPASTRYFCRRATDTTYASATVAPAFAKYTRAPRRPEFVERAVIHNPARDTCVGGW